jgi:GT2 family glycosyltransferase
LDLSIIIVNWNTEKLIYQCLSSIYNTVRNISFEIFVVDNNSSDNSTVVISENFKDVKLIANKTNNGFAKANNQAIKHAKGRCILLLNPDTIVMEKSIEEMVRYLDNNDGVGIVSCRLLNGDYTLQESCRRLPNIRVYSMILLKLHHLFPNSGALRNYFMKDMDYEVENDVEQVMGAVLMYKRDILKQDPSYLDEDYWIWFEEVDFCRRALDLGYKIRYIPYVSIVHYKAQSFNQVLRLRQQRNFIKSLKTYFKKNGRKSDIVLVNIISPISLVISFIVQSFKLFKFKRGYG